ncbi:hypothetical protein EWM64_g7403 [Hericium alpestre]|uniref:G-patch domain-containing protein n=1 Tax=Hericium alpestre TaxID=135208 RepID=A0A4Y9ZSZ5_9AGAM|nr:hypothetical protein EWM64_g7403 [Hericium alpestre]
MEEGEIVDASQAADAYDPAYEWPGDDDEEQPVPPQHLLRSSRDPSTFRLIVHKTGILSSRWRLAIFDGHTEVQFGRDAAPPGTETPRVRLKEMEVSKVHATVFWDADRREWAVVDMGSKHGTFVASGNAEGRGAPTGPGQGGTTDERGIRLSAPRVASVPRRLGHMDRLTMGSTTFVVHVHEDRLPCIDCMASAQAIGDEIPLFDARQQKEEDAKALQKRKREAEDVEARVDTPPAGRDAKKALTSLKRDLLTRHAPSPSTPLTSKTPSPSPVYVDRSARRRALHTSSAPDMPGIPPVAHLATTSRQRPEKPAQIYEPPSLPRSVPPAPLSTTNVGHRLLMKQGWEPGTALGLPDTDLGGESMRLVEPLDVTGNINRAGLGMRVDTAESSSSTWVQKRWNSLPRTGS